MRPTIIPTDIRVLRQKSINAWAARLANPLDPPTAFSKRLWLADLDSWAEDDRAETEWRQWRVEQAPKFWAKVQIGAPDECWNWQGGTSEGYGQTCFSGLTERAHRVAYEFAVGPIPPGLFILHSCDNRRCCNPRHLEPGSHEQNMWQAHERGRFHLPRKNQKLTDADALNIRKTFAESNPALIGSGALKKELAAQYNVTASTINAVIQRKTFAHI
jgi:hypothetical protein